MIKTIDINIQSETTLAIGTYLKRLQFKDLSPNTISKYTLCLRCYEKWLMGERVSEDSAQTFLNFLRQKNLSWASVQAYYHAIRPFLADQGIKFQAKFRKIKRLPQYYEPAQIQLILDSAINRTDKWSHLAPRDTLIMMVLAYSGIRKAELLALQVRDISFHANMIRVHGKGSKDRTVPIDPRIHDLLEKHVKNMQVNDRLFPLSPSRLGVIIKNYARAAGMPEFSPHKFRHYFATQIVENYPNASGLKKAQQLLGHADISTTAIYQDCVPKQLADAMAYLPDLRGVKK